jgi:hypothetical protein
MSFPQNSIFEAINAKNPWSSMAWALPQKPGGYKCRCRVICRILDLRFDFDMA